MTAQNLPGILFAISAAIFAVCAYFKMRSRSDPTTEIVMACMFVCVALMFVDDGDETATSAPIANVR
jgi:uncharacterized membrane protein (DUF4010 family)